MIDGTLSGLINGLIAFLILFIIGILTDYPTWRKKQKKLKSQTHKQNGYTGK